CSPAQIDQWQAGHQGSAVRSVALTDNGCYLASTGDSGRISLWPIAATGERHRASPIGLASFANTSSPNSIDIHLTTDNVVLVATDTPGQQLQVYRKQLNSHGCQ
ncbi:MAG: WD40 repeat domain-containing protein, partial [Cyanobacteria bacterium P01_D01_bin.2]